MRNMKIHPSYFAVVLILIVGCGRPPISKNIAKVGEKDKDKVGREHDAIATFADSARYPENPRVSDDWTRLRDGLQALAGKSSTQDVGADVRLTLDNRKFLEGHANLNDAEMAEVESQSFRPADAHYLDECFLLRAAARSVEVRTLDPIEQANHYFLWVMRNVILHEQVDTWIPPAFALRRGHADALDRALVFLALLRQGRGEGCLIVVPDSEPLLFLVAVHDAKDKNLRLFDPRLEMAVRGKDGKSIATLSEVETDAALLEPSGFTEAQVKKLEPRLVCPLYALAPRMLDLQKKLHKNDPIVLHLAADKLHREISALTKTPVKVWNSQAKDKTPPLNSPTRALRMFLAKQDGGIDEANRAVAVAQARVPLHDTLANYARVNIRDDVLPRTAWQMLQGISERLLLNYDLQTRDLYLRGQHEALRRRQERLLSFARNDTLVDLAQSDKFRAELEKWRDTLKKVHANLLGDADPKMRARAEPMLQAMWTQDEFLEMLVDVEKEMKIDPDTGRPVRELLFEVITKTDPKTDKTVTEVHIRVTTRIIAIGLRDYLHFELARSQAFANHEKAEQLQAKLRAAGNPDKGAQTRADEAWILAKSAWGNFYIERIALQALIDQRLTRLSERVPSDRIDPFAHRLVLLETLHLDVHKYFQAKIRFAECLPHVGTDGAKKAHVYLQRTREEIDALLKSGALHAEVKKLAESLPPERRAALKKRLDLLANDWTERGNYFWIQRQIDLRLKTLAR